MAKDQISNTQPKVNPKHSLAVTQACSLFVVRVSNRHQRYPKVISPKKLCRRDGGRYKNDAQGSARKKDLAFRKQRIAQRSGV
jgi:hypothetical protein